MDEIERHDVPVIEHPPPEWITAADVREIIREHDRRLAARLRVRAEHPTDERSAWDAPMWRALAEILEVEGVVEETDDA